MKILFFCRFLNQMRLPKTVFWTNIKKMFFAIQYINILQLTKTFVDNMCALVLWKQRNGCNIFFMNVTKNNKTFCQNKVLVCSKVMFLAFLKTLKLFLAIFFIIFCSIHAKWFCNYFLIFYQTKSTCFSKSFLNC